MVFLFNISFLKIDFLDFIDIGLVAFLLYQVYHLIQGSIASRVFLGYLLLYLFYLLVRALGMELLSTILGQFMEVGVLALMIIFQPEIRRFLLMIGRSTTLQHSSLFGKFITQKEKNPQKVLINPIMGAIRSMAETKTGALIVLSQENSLARYIESGDLIDSIINKRLLLSIFFKNSPLHDGAVIIVGEKIKAARCTLPVSERENIPSSLGFRHRAAIGISEHTDAFVIVVSEETGEISLSKDGILKRSITLAELEERIKEDLHISKIEEE